MLWLMKYTNVPLAPGAGHNTYVEAMERIVLPALGAFKPDVIVIACGFDAAAIDPSSGHVIVLRYLGPAASGIRLSGASAAGSSSGERRSRPPAGEAGS